MGVAYNPQILTSGLQMYLDAGNARSYPGSGASWFDLTGNGNTGTVTNAVYGSGNGGSFTFSGNSNYVQVANSASISPTTAITVAFWVNLSGNSETAIRKDPSDYLFEFGSSGGGTSGLCPQWYVNTSNGANFRYSDTSLTTNTWYYMVGTYAQGGTGTVYQNGVSITTTNSLTGTGTIVQNNSYLRIGSHGAETFLGKISAVTVYNTVLTADQIWRNFTALRGRYGI